MISKEAWEFDDKTLRELCENDIPFGNKSIVIEGDFRQILHVVSYGTTDDVIKSCLKSSYLWPLFKKCILKINLRS